MPTTLTNPQTTQAPVVQQPSAASSPMQSNTGSQQFTAAQKNWALAASAVLTEFNRERHDTLAGVPLNETSKIHARQLLQEWWGIGNRDDLQRALVWIEQGGHRAQFSAIGERVSQMPPEDVKRAIAAVDVEDANSVLVAQRYYAKLGSQSITGWDYARYISLCRWGYASGYLSQEEAWDRIMDAARTVQGTFGSWRELGENYLIGRQFWSLHQTRKDGAAMRAAYTRLLNNPSSPWNRIPWNLDLR